MLNIIELQASKKHSNIFWISSVNGLDEKILKFAACYNFQFFDENDLNNDILTDIFNHLKQDEKQPHKKYVKNFIIFDDVLVSPKKQSQLQLLLKTYRHINTSIFSLS